jgi:hypothetical protein
MNYRVYRAVDPDDPRFEAAAVLEGNELSLDIRVELETGERSINLQWPDQLRRILTYFANRYESLKVCWSYGDNLKAFNRASAAGADLRRAALRTPIGHQLGLAGYREIAIESLEGLPGWHTKVVVCFRKS